ncbi:MAG: DUF2190 family protein [Myxococcales bacterium]|nr:DUF2190 family protein [Myxococcales bacterium]
MAATYRDILTRTVKAGAAVVGKRMVGYNGQHAGAGAVALGASTTDAALDEHFPCMVLGVAIVTAGAAIAAGAAVEVGTAGKVITLNAGAKVGRAITAAGADGDNIEVLLIPG